MVLIVKIPVNAAARVLKLPAPTAVSTISAIDNDDIGATFIERGAKA